MTTYPNMGLTLPTRGPSGAGIWGDTQDENTFKLDGHDHSAGKGTQINTAGINIDADLTFSGTYAPTNLHRITFASIVALTGNNKSLFVDEDDNELYWRSNTGTNVKLTVGNALNVGAFVGGFVGDVSEMNASYDSATTGYRFRTSALDWARGSFGGVRLLERGTAETVYVEHVAPAALAASWTVTWPLAPPGATAPMRMDASGVITATESHGDKTKVFHGLDLHAFGSGIYGTNWTQTISPRATSKSLTAVDLVLALGGFEVGQRLKSVTFALFGDGVADVSSVDVIRCDSSTGGAVTSIGSVGPISNTPSSFTDYTIDVTDTVWTATMAMHVRFILSAANLEIGNVRVVYDRP